MRKHQLHKLRLACIDVEEVIQALGEDAPVLLMAVRDSLHGVIDFYECPVNRSGISSKVVHLQSR